MSHNTVYMFKTVNPRPPLNCTWRTFIKEESTAECELLTRLTSLKGQTHAQRVCVSAQKWKSKAQRELREHGNKQWSFWQYNFRHYSPAFSQPEWIFLICMNVPNMHKKWNIFIYIMHHETKTEMRSATRKSNIHKEDKQEFCILLVVILKQ